MYAALLLVPGTCLSSLPRFSVNKLINCGVSLLLIALFFEQCLEAGAEMPNQVSMGALMTCTFGAAPSALLVLPLNKVLAEGPPAANMMDHIPLAKSCRLSRDTVECLGTGYAGYVPADGVRIIAPDCYKR